jgi:hydroxymethylpyrimidine/phosphomethylpyrimidine kinase
MLQKCGKPSMDVRHLEDLKSLAAAVHALGPKYVLLKGGHLPLKSDYTVANTDDEKKLVTNILFSGDSVDVIEFPFQKTRHTHGTGCSLACEFSTVAIVTSHADPSQLHSHVTLHLAWTYFKLSLQQADMSMPASRLLSTWAAVLDPSTTSTRCKYCLLRRKTDPSRLTYRLPSLTFYRGGFVEYILDRSDVKPVWHAFTHHDFVEKMGDGTLSTDLFKNYMIQDYLYLVSNKHFRKVFLALLTIARFNSLGLTLLPATRPRTLRTSPP